MQKQKNAERAIPPLHGKPETRLLFPGMETPAKWTARRGGSDKDHHPGPNVDAQAFAVPQPDACILPRSLVFVSQLFRTRIENTERPRQAQSKPAKTHNPYIHRFRYDRENSDFSFITTWSSRKSYTHPKHQRVRSVVPI